MTRAGTGTPDAKPGSISDRRNRIKRWEVGALNTQQITSSKHAEEEVEGGKADTY